MYGLETFTLSIYDIIYTLTAKEGMEAVSRILLILQLVISSKKTFCVAGFLESKDSQVIRKHPIYGLC